MVFVTDRTEMDVAAGLAKGCYSCEDLNRVEGNVQEICEMASQIGIDMNLTVKTDWAPPGDFVAAAWPTEKQMSRYLGNVKKICEALGVSINLPGSMRYLTVAGANNIEIALKLAFEEIQRRMT